MKLELSQNIDLRQKLNTLLVAIIKLVVRLSDFSINKHISLSEAILFALSTGRAAWFIAFGVQNANYDYVLSDGLWTAYFTTASVIHLCGFFTKSLKLRIVANYFYALVWTFTLILALLSRTTAPAAPLLAVLATLSLFIIVRLSEENGDAEKLAHERV